MGPAHNLGCETRKHLIGSVRGRDEQTDLRRVAAPLFNALAGGVDAQVSRRTGWVHRRAAEEIRVIVHGRVAVLNAETANRVDELRRELVHHRGNQLCGAEHILRGRGACLNQANHLLSPWG